MSRRPLDGIRVLELAQVVAGPFCGTLMAEFGAEVIKTEMPGRGDDLRRLGPSEDGTAYWFAVDNRNKKLMTLDLHLPGGQAIVKRLVEKCDVVLENFRPGVLEKWGLGWEVLHAINPRLVMARITAFGQTGPLRDGPGYAAIGSAFGGTWYVNGHADRPPARPTPVYPDYMTGLFTAFGVMAALRHRDLTGEGQWIDAALYESAFRVMEYTATLYGRQKVVRERGGLQHSGWPGGAFQTQDGHWIVFTAPAQHLFERFCAMLGRPELPKDPRFATAGERPKHLADILDLATQWFAERPAEKVLEALKTADVPHSPIMSMADIFADPHYRAREMLIDVPAEGLGTLPQPGVIPKLSATPGRVEFAGAALGRHTDEILSGLLGMSAAEIARLREGKVI
ncbi:MAG TPA: CaiB/BaiF CoA-transferase family protein [Methylomirabilota bacterium]|nr:CaiB/BaiF CoA-transferase family protein [Methylomirabilota bacterium]